MGSEAAMKKSDKPPWAQTSAGIITLLIFFWPAGLYLMWKYTDWNKIVKIVITAFLGIATITVLPSVLNPAPILSVSNVSNGKVSTDEKTYTVTGAVTGAEDADVTVNGEDAMWAGDKFSSTVDLKDGDNQITVIASKGNQKDEEKFVVYKTPESQLAAKREAEAKAKADAENASAKAEADKKAAEIAASQPKTSFGDGVWLVGKDIKAGTYRNNPGTSTCYWQRSSGTSGSFDEIIANDNPRGPAVVTIQASDNSFTSQRCGTWSLV